MKIKKGTKIICSLFGSGEAKVTFYNPITQEVSFRYKGDKYDISSHIDNIQIIK